MCASSVSYYSLHIFLCPGFTNIKRDSLDFLLIIFFIRKYRHRNLQHYSISGLWNFQHVYSFVVWSWATISLHSHADIHIHLLWSYHSHLGLYRSHLHTACCTIQLLEINSYEFPKNPLFEYNSIGYPKAIDFYVFPFYTWYSLESLYEMWSVVFRNSVTVFLQQVKKNQNLDSFHTHNFQFFHELIIIFFIPNASKDSNFYTCWDWVTFDIRPFKAP